MLFRSYVKYKDFEFVICDKKVINTDIFISKSKINGAKDGDKVVVKMLQWDINSKNRTKRKHVII